MRDFRLEIDDTEDPNVLREVIAQLAAEIETLEALPYEDDGHMERIHDLELVRRYGEHKLEGILA